MYPLLVRCVNSPPVESLVVLKWRREIQRFSSTFAPLENLSPRDKLNWAEIARLARGLVLELREREFVLAAVSLGLSETRILFRHILPNAARPLIVQLSLMLPAFLLAETALSYLGVGVPEPGASWGNMLREAGNSTLLSQQPLVLLAPAFAIFLFVLGVRLLSDGLRQDDDIRAR